MNEQLEEAVREQIARAESDHDEWLWKMQSLHRTAFELQWKADNKPENRKAIDSAFAQQQKDLAARKIALIFRFSNGTTRTMREISDPLLSAIYVAGLKIEKL